MALSPLPGFWNSSPLSKFCLYPLATAGAALFLSCVPAPVLLILGGLEPPEDVEVEN